MSKRPIWRGHLRLALVTCPVALYKVHHEREALKFNMINPVTGNRVNMVMVDGGTRDEVQRKEMVKGYEYRKGSYLLLTDEDFDSAKIESSSLMNVEKFVPADTIDPRYYDDAYYLAPDGDAGRDVYAVLLQAIAQSGKTALTKVVMSRRERTVALRPVEGGIMAHTLHEDRDLDSSVGIFDERPAKADPSMVQLALQLVERQTAAFEPGDIEDRYETKLRELIAAKLKGEGIETTVEEVRANNVIDLMAALKGSLEGAPGTIEAAPQEKTAPKRKRA